jgi:hypothetical protein
MKTRSLHIASLCALLMLGSAGSFAATYNSQLTYRVGEKTFAAHVETSASPAKATVFIIHDWDGLTDYEKSRTKMLSDLGFDTIAIDLFGVDAKLENRDDYKRETGALYKDRTEFRAPLSAADDAGIKSGTNSEKSLSSAIALAVPPHLRRRALDLRLMAL